MRNQDMYEEFIQKLMSQPLPSNPLARIRILAKELAQGAAEGIWEANIPVNPHEELDPNTGQRVSTIIPDRDFEDYFLRRWSNNYPNLFLLRQNGYVDDRFRFTKASFDLIEEIEPAQIFISYRRKESSAFALLVLARLKEFELNAFLDMSIRPGDNWHAFIKEQIQQRNYFILLLGKESLVSDYVKQEILWAIEAGAEIIPIWHNGYEYVKDAIDLPPEIDQVLGSTHTIRVLEESALAYNNAIVELLNRFGITP